MLLAGILAPPGVPATEARRAFGRAIATDFPLPRLLLGDAHEQPSVTITTSGQPCTAALPSLSGEDRFQREASADGARYLAGGIGEFKIAESGTLITYSLVENASAGDVQHVLTGPALVMALQLQGEFFLHAAALEVHGKMFALAAAHGFGKSTIAGSLLNAGHRVFSDDVVPLREHEGAIVGRQGHSWIKLWDASLDALGGNPAEFDEVLVGAGKRVVPAFPPSDEELPLGGVLVLAPHLCAERAISVTRLGGADAAFALMANVYCPELTVGRLAASALSFATGIANSVPVRVISYYRSFENLPAIRDAILRDAEGIASSGE